jgi:hypothetical protein
MGQDMEPPNDDEFVNPLENPERANAEIAALLTGGSSADNPVIPPPPADLVTLPGGLVKQGAVITTAVVRELTGIAEEALAKAGQSAAQTGNWAHFVSVLLEHGTARIGDANPKKTTSLLKDLLVGDRDQILLGIRQATYGDEVALPGWTCPGCSKQSDLTVSLADDVEVVRLSNPQHETTFKVPLRKGRVATVRLATVHDELAAFERDGLTTPERDSVLLSRCVTAITEADGAELVTAGLGAPARAPIQ